ncbi:MAG TPA: hypothetical protein VF988_05340 [Verrucomicrobiae bacterium]
MSFENPTRLRIAMQGQFAGKNYRVLGRVLMGETENGETYFWNEFNLQADDGSSADLVYEETEHGGQWRMFSLFEPEYPLTASDAAAKRVGDRLNLTGHDVRVTFRGSSCVFRIEGQGPDGVKVGDRADYFNAEAGPIMQVVSWTGDEVEYYNGVNLTAAMVASAFNLRPIDLGGTAPRVFSALRGSDSGNYTSTWKFAAQAGLVVLVFFLIFGRSLSCSTSYEAAAVKHISASPSRLAVGATGKLDDKDYRIVSHAVVQIAEVGAQWERHEYQLADDSGANMLLVCGAKPGASDWVLFEPFSPVLLAPTAEQLAAKKMGDLLELDGYTGKVTEILLSTIRRVEGETSSLTVGQTSFGVKSVNEYRTALIRWNRESITYYRGRPIAASRLLAAFHAK